jgi:glycerophosphoryl diester phosphodiesterase
MLSQCIVIILASSAISISPRDAYPQIVSHRGACGYVPEHSLQAYQLAIDLMTDFVELDLGLSKDGLVCCFHTFLYFHHFYPFSPSNAFIIIGCL